MNPNLHDQLARQTHASCALCMFAPTSPIDKFHRRHCTRLVLVIHSSSSALALLEAPASDPSLLQQGVDPTRGHFASLDDVCCLTVAAVDKVHADVGTGIPAHSHSDTARLSGSFTFMTPK